MEKIKLLCLTCLMAALLGMMPGGAAWAFDGDDGGSDDGGFDDGGDGDDEGQDHDGDGHHDGQGHHHHDHLIVHHHHGGWGWPGFGPGFGFGGFGYMPPFYPSYYAYPPLAVQPPPVYIQQQNAAQPAHGSQANWHYCQASEGYYPEVKECPDGWQQVAPQPPPQPPPPASHDNQG